LSRKADRGDIKVCNIDPAVLAPCRTWDNMKAEEHRPLTANGSSFGQNYTQPSVYKGIVAAAMLCAKTMTEVAQQFASCIFA